MRARLAKGQVRRRPQPEVRLMSMWPGTWQQAPLALERGAGAHQRTGDEGSGTEAEGRRSRKRAASASRNLVESAAKRQAGVASPSRPAAPGAQQLEGISSVGVSAEINADVAVGMDLDGAADVNGIMRTDVGGVRVRRRLVLTGGGGKTKE